ncbi:hypothetical protein YC2023_082798 [Brassica napus]
MTMTILKQVHQKEGVVDSLELIVIGDRGRRVVEAKDLENRAYGRGQRSSATGGSKSTKKACIRRRSEVNTDEVRDYICTSRTVGFAYTKKTNTEEGIDVVLLTPPKPNNQHNRVIEDDDDFVESVRSCETGESVDVVLNQAATLNQHKSSHLGWFVSSDRRHQSKMRCLRANLVSPQILQQNEPFCFVGAQMHVFPILLLLLRRPRESVDHDFLNGRSCLVSAAVFVFHHTAKRILGRKKTWERRYYERFMIDLV